MTAVEQPWTLDLGGLRGPFDLLVTLILNEDVDLLEVHLAEIVLAYIERLEARGELDLEAATEFLILIAALLELKSRLMLPSEDEEGLDLEPAEAAEELLARLLEYRKFRAASEWMHARVRLASGRTATAPRRCRPSCGASRSTRPRKAYEPDRLADAMRGAAAYAAGRGHEPHDPHHGVARAPPRAWCATCSRAAAASPSTTRSADSDRMTQAVTLFALLELYKTGELVWRQRETFGADRDHVPRRVVNPIARQLTALLFCSPEPVSRADLCEAIGCAEARLDDAIEELRAQFAPRADGHRAARGRRAG